MKNFSTSLPEDCNMDDRVLVQTLVTELLFSGCVLTVIDGEETCLETSSDYIEILKALSSTGEDILDVVDKDNNDLGWFHLIYNNGSDGDPMICLHDYCGNQFCESIYKKVNSELEVA